jgi:pyrroline-5-carboxylate reductase
MSIAIVGAGNLGGAVAAGLVASGAVPLDALRCVTRTEDGAARLRARPGMAEVQVGTDAAAAVAGADLVMLGVKPYAVLDLLRGLAPRLEAGVTLVSLAAGVGLDELRDAAPQGAHVVRLLTNTPVQVRAATSLVAAASDVDPDVLARVVALSDAIGRTHVVDESLLDVGTALAGAGPAYVFLLVEMLRDAAVTLGLDPAVALEMARSMVDGAARLLTASDDDPAELRRAVTSPGGMTAAAIAVFEEAGLRSTVTDAVAAAVARAAELQAGPPTGPATGQGSARA